MKLGARSTAFAALFVYCGCVTAARACHGFAIEESFARSSNLFSRSAAAFLVLRNHGSQDCHIVDISSDISERTLLLSSEIDANGIVRAREMAKGLFIPQRNVVQLMRGGTSVMFIGLRRPILHGDVISLTSGFSDGAESLFLVPVGNRQ